MKLKSALLCALLWLSGFTVYAQKYIIGSFNVRNDNPSDVGNMWVQRRDVAANLLRFHQFDVFGTQEAKKNQLDDLLERLPEYAAYGLGRDNGKPREEHSTIFYLKDKFKLLKKGDFWLSETPDRPGLGWDATCCNRICSYVYLQDKKTGKKFYFFNAHYDHQGKVAQLESSKLLLKKMKEIAGQEPAIFTGDLNVDQNSEAYTILNQSGYLTDSFSQVKSPYVNNSSFNGWGKKMGTNEIIDHVFVTKHFMATRWGLITDTYQGKYPSDHFPVLVDLKMK
jgi:endonuclease/exonuclease/phosphatase family metal-dependent hydrolase